MNHAQLYNALTGGKTNGRLLMNALRPKGPVWQTENPERKAQWADWTGDIKDPNSRRKLEIMFDNTISQMIEDIGANPRLNDLFARKILSDVKAGKPVNEAQALSYTTASLPAKILSLQTSIWTKMLSKWERILGVQPISQTSGKIWYHKPQLNAAFTNNSVSYPAGTNLNQNIHRTGGSDLEDLGMNRAEGDAVPFIKFGLTSHLVETDSHALGVKLPVEKEQDFRSYFGQSAMDLGMMDVDGILGRNISRSICDAILNKAIVTGNIQTFDLDGYLAYAANDAFVARKEWTRMYSESLAKASKTALANGGEKFNILIGGEESLAPLIERAFDQDFADIRLNSEYETASNNGTLADLGVAELGSFQGRLNVFVFHDWPSRYDSVALYKKAGSDFDAAAILYFYIMGYVTPQAIDNDYLNMSQVMMNRLGLELPDETVHMLGVIRNT